MREKIIEVMADGIFDKRWMERALTALEAAGYVVVPKFNSPNGCHDYGQDQDHGVVLFFDNQQDADQFMKWMNDYDTSMIAAAQEPRE